MKTSNNISNLKKMVITLSAALVLTATSFASNNATSCKSEEMNSAARLEALMNSTEQSLKFVAPSTQESVEVYSAFERLNEMAETTAASIVYVAPAVEEASAELESLNVIAASTEASIKYVAPAADDAAVCDTTTSPATNDMLVYMTK
jgi:hypothetical protein